MSAGDGVMRRDEHGDPVPFSEAGVRRLIDRLTELGLDPERCVDGRWTATCPLCGSVVLIDPVIGSLLCLGCAA